MDISTRTLGVIEGDGGIAPVEQFPPDMDVAENALPDTEFKYAQFKRSEPFIEVLGYPLDLPTALSVYNDLGEALAFAAESLGRGADA